MQIRIPIIVLPLKVSKQIFIPPFLQVRTYCKTVTNILMQFIEDGIFFDESKIELHDIKMR